MVNLAECPACHKRSMQYDSEMDVFYCFKCDYVKSDNYTFKKNKYRDNFRSEMRRSYNLLGVTNITFSVKRWVDDRAKYAKYDWGDTSKKGERIVYRMNKDDYSLSMLARTEPWISFHWDKGEKNFSFIKYFLVVPPAILTCPPNIRINGGITVSGKTILDTLPKYLHKKVEGIYKHSFIRSKGTILLDKLSYGEF